MKLTIIVEDGIVIIDGEGRKLDLSICRIPNNIHALQWKESAGWIEFVENADGTKPQNEIIEALPTWANTCVKAWQDWTPPVYTAPTEATQQPSTTGTQTA